MKDTFFYSKKTLNAGGKIIDLSVPIVMGIMNVTPDSFYKNSRSQNEKEILERAEKIVNEGGSIIDIGGYSTRPGADDITIAEEASRVLPAVKLVRKEFPEILISIDTFRSEIVKEAVEEGAQIVNDISGGSLDEKMFEMVAYYKTPYVLMHMKGTPKTMSKLTVYKNLVEEIMDYFVEKVVLLQDLGVKDLIIDPGFGFAKTGAHNYELLQKLNYFKTLKLPILVGVSRKSMIYKTLNTDPDNTVNGTSVLNTIALLNGAHILRVHDVKEAVETVKLFKSVYP